MRSDFFGPPAGWPAQDLIGYSYEFDASIAVGAYCSGVFPMPLDDTAMGWWSPVTRGVLPLENLRVTRSLRQSAKHYTTTIDQAFPQVIARCGDPRRPNGWIDPRIVQVYTELFERGIAHSVEVWDAASQLVGGLYGVSLGGLFAGESMFHDQKLGRDASKVALWRLATVLRQRPVGLTLLDVQWVTPHLASLGAVEISRADYLRQLGTALRQPETWWPTDTP